MNKSRKTKKKIIISIISLAFCLSLLFGSTFAWFTSAISVRTNNIQSGNLAMEVSYKPFGLTYTEWTKIDSKTKIFNENAIYEPGYTEAVWIRVENTGALGFKYRMDLEMYEEIAGINLDNEMFKLSDHLTVMSGLHTTDYVGIENSCNDGETLLTDFVWTEKYLNGGKVTIVKDLNIHPKNDSENNQDSTYYICMILHMPDLGSSEANHNGEKVPQLKIGMNAMAMQFPYEEDSYGKDYDTDAE